jgi:hypothetical protein
MTRAQHIAWCKERALEYIDKGEVANAMASFTSDMGKHAETERQMNPLARLAVVATMQDTVAGGTDNTRKFIEGF